jgi:glutathione synthase/RimK-type ligase-like ATP-grasp enzyme
VGEAGLVLIAVDEATSGLTEDDRHFVTALERHGARVEPLRWGRNVASEATVVIRSTWDYIEQPTAFARWLDQLEAADVTVHNPVALMRWNMHKRYLVDLALRGVPTVPTRIVHSGERLDLSTVRAEFGWNEVVVKPAVGGTARLADNSRRVGLAAVQGHLDRMLQSEDALIQPYVESIATAGEVSVVAIAGDPCLAIRKVPAAGDWRTQAEFNGTASITPLTTSLERITAAALGALDTTPSYARIDVTGDPSHYQLLELELIEPELFFRFDPTIAERLVHHVLNRGA